MKLFEVANQYCKESTWKTLALIKFCLFSMGIIVGVFLPDSLKTMILVVFGIVFLITYIPLMRKFYSLWKTNNQ